MGAVRRFPRRGVRERGSRRKGQGGRMRLAIGGSARGERLIPSASDSILEHQTSPPRMNPPSTLYNTAAFAIIGLFNKADPSPSACTRYPELGKHEPFDPEGSVRGSGGSGGAGGAGGSESRRYLVDFVLLVLNKYFSSRSQMILLN